jgi:glycosyltransferase involved in cell wall biosynthesis
VFHQADVFALTPVVAADGDRDGVRNVLVEAMACGLPVVTTDAGGISELVLPGSNGLLAPARDVAAIAEHLAVVLDDPALRQQLGVQARRTVEADYDIRDAGRRLRDLFAGVEARP